MTMTLLRRLFAVLIAAALVGAPVQAAIVMPCDTVIASAPDHPLFSDQAPAATPCDGMRLICPDMIGCGVIFDLPAQVPGVVQRLIWAAADYWATVDLPPGLSVEPDIDPPIMI
jgi:hypothetical protein